MSPGPRPIIENGLNQLGIETRFGVSVTALDEAGVTLSDGEHIESLTVIWATGMRAAPLTSQIPGEHDNFGRLVVDRGEFPGLSDYRHQSIDFSSGGLHPCGIRSF